MQNGYKKLATTTYKIIAGTSLLLRILANFKFDVFAKYSYSSTQRNHTE